MTCDRCGKVGPDRAAVIVPDGEYGFCSVACLVLWVRAIYIEAAA